MIPDSTQYSFAPQPILGTFDVTIRNVCSTKGLSKLICGSFVIGIGGKGQGEMAPEFFKNFFAGTLLKVLKHFLQLYVGKRFGMYDCGPIGNMQHYRQKNPPVYYLRRVASDRIMLARGLADFLSAPEDQVRPIDELGTKPYLDIVVPDYSHFDWIVGMDLIRKVNGPAMVAIYELMHKDGPNILRGPEQYQAILHVSGVAKPINQIQSNQATIQMDLNANQRIMSQQRVDSIRAPGSELIQKIFGTTYLVRQFVGK